ncbi:uncharacterized protein FTJAE_8855 [Fusarium tjaetaba]|uniref:Uncharacterized protein n=1 Tax=Fusarium tjaetaba TaxID=1567544 RepID=A0A8H5R8G9_9HYPO|nr:uncharacterized protein FTJAE_8855 [Fusarium tjaetaba]KAF5628318.1 hypothetical protein FTJAE_8855 [Fusarium tjaetaba]
MVTSLPPAHVMAMGSRSTSIGTGEPKILVCPYTDSTEVILSTCHQAVFQHLLHPTLSAKIIQRLSEYRLNNGVSLDKVIVFCCFIASSWTTLSEADNVAT